MAAPAAQSGDHMLWLAALAVGGMGLAWLVIEAPWSTEAGPEPAAHMAPDAALARSQARKMRAAVPMEKTARYRGRG